MIPQFKRQLKDAYEISIKDRITNWKSAVEMIIGFGRLGAHFKNGVFKGLNKSLS